MCGIAGVIDRHGRNQELVAEQLRLLRHRGPDSTGLFGKNGAVIGQSRLAVIDLDTGDPPISNEDGTVGAVLNGEIYNFLTLRDELRASGHTLVTRGDTEVLVHLAEEEEPAGIARRLDGMFSFAVWDDRRRRLILGRDRVGKKPLYYCALPDRFVFASELKAVLAHPGVPREMEPRALPAYLTFGYAPTPLTFYRGVHSVPPGHVLTVDEALAPRLERYWEPPVAGAGKPPRPDISLDAAAERVRVGLEAAVRNRLVSDVPLGAFLSGGIDSSAIVAIMARHDSRKVKTFTIGFDDSQGFDERPFARAVARRYATEHHEFVASPDLIELVEQLVWHHDQPFGDSSAIPTYLLAQQTRSEVTVALSGDGGDELFAGYERFAAALAIERWGMLPGAVHELTGRAIRRLPPTALGGRVTSARRFNDAAALGLPAAYRQWLAFCDEDQRRALLGEPDGWALRDYDGLWRSTAGAPTLERLLNVNLRTYLVDDLLVKADRMSMAHGLEVRSPFLDTDLLEVALGLPARLHIKGFARKRVLKRAVADLLPAEILNRRKRGFGVPLDRWFREDLAGYLRSRLGGDDARIRRHLAGGQIDAMLAEHAAGGRDHGQALWALLTLEVFLRREDF
jgi:asparagine synthase (glutamine-hydrolysing)